MRNRLKNSKLFNYESSTQNSGTQNIYKVEDKWLLIVRDALFD